MKSFKLILSDIKNDLPQKGFGLKFFLHNYLYNPGFRVLLNYRLGKYFHNYNKFLFKHISLCFKYRMVVKRNCDISYDAVIGKKLNMPHPIGIVIGEGVEIKDNVKIFQHVTLGSHGSTGKHKSYPIIEDGVKIYAGATVIGGITVGKNAIIGAHSLVNKNIPENAIAVGVPCKILIQ